MIKWYNHILLLILTGILLIGCYKNDRHLILENDKGIKQIFNRKEITALKNIVNFYDSIVTECTNEHNILQAWNSYFENLRKSSTSYNELYRNLNLKESDKEQIINEMKRDGIFNVLFNYEYGLNFERTDTINVSIIPNIEGKYMNLLLYIADCDTTFKGYEEVLPQLGAVPKALLFGFHSRNYDFGDEKIRLICALHFLMFDKPIPEI